MGADYLCSGKTWHHPKSSIPPSSSSLYPCSLRERPHGSGCNFPRDFGSWWGHKGLGGGSQEPGHRCPRGCSGLPSRGRDAGRRRHPAASPLDGATNPAWSRRRASPALPRVPSPGRARRVAPAAASAVAASPPCVSGGQPRVPAERWAHTPRWCSKRRPRCRADAMPRGSGFVLVLWALPLCCLEPRQR